MNRVVQLSAGAASLRLLPHAGGRVSALRLVRPRGSALDVLHPYPEDFFDPIHWAKGGIYPLMPYSNRIANARVLVNGETVALLPHPDAAPHSLHGNAHALAWQLESCAQASASMTLDAQSSPAWPWRYRGRIDIALTPSELSMRIEIRNVDARSIPAGVGLHPYFRHRSDARLGYRASAFWPTTPEFLPLTPRAPLVDEMHAPARPLPEGGLTRYVSGWDGRLNLDLPGASPSIPQGERVQVHDSRLYRLHIQADPVFDHLVVHRPDNLAYLCIEPVSHVADGFNLSARGVEGTGARMLAPGESLAGTVRFSLEDLR